MEWYRFASNQVLEELNSSQRGLSQSEAEKRQVQYGKNRIQEKKKKNWFQVFLGQFQDLLVWILIAAAIVSAMTDNGESSVVIGAVLLLNAVLGTIEHQKAEKSLEGLRALSAPEARVIRDGKRVKVAAEDIVPGDIFMLEAGDLVAADGRLLEAAELRVNESSLTGEAAEVEKEIRLIKESNVPLAARSNMVFSGSLVTGGRGLAVVTEVGMNTEIGRIAGLMNETEEKRTPLEISLERFSGKLAAGILAVCVVVFLLIFTGSSAPGCGDVCSSIGCGSDTGSVRFDCYHCPGDGNTEDGKRTGNYQRVKSSRKPGLCLGYLHRQNRNTYTKPNGNRRNLLRGKGADLLPG